MSQLCYQDFKDTIVCNTQLFGFLCLMSKCCVIRISKILLYAIHNMFLQLSCIMIVVLSGFQRYFCMQYTTIILAILAPTTLCYQDFKDTFVCNTQHIRDAVRQREVVLSGFQRYFCMQYTTIQIGNHNSIKLCYQDFNENLLQKYIKNRKYTNLYEYILLFQKKILPLQQQI